MSQLHKDVLKQLFPIELDGDFEADISLEGDQLDAAMQNADKLLTEMYPDTADELLPDWERFLGVIFDPGDTQQDKQNKLVAKVRERGGLSIPYFTALAAALGHTITVEEFQPLRTGIGKCGQKLYISEIMFCWRVKLTGAQDVYLEALFNKLKRADTYVDFEYS